MNITPDPVKVTIFKQIIKLVLPFVRVTYNKFVSNLWVDTAPTTRIGACFDRSV